MSIDARINRLMPVLTAKERGILVLRSLKDKTPENVEWRRSMPREQTAEFNRYINLMNACNIHLPLYITMVEQHTEQLWLRVYWLHSLIQAGRLIWDLGKLIPVRKHGAAVKAIEGSFPVIELPWEAEEHEYSWLTVTEDMQTDLRLLLVSLWQELRSIDVVVDEVPQEFDGEDPLRPIMRGIVEKTRRDLSLLHEAFGQTEPLELPEPDDESMELARKYFDNGFRLMAKL